MGSAIVDDGRACADVAGVDVDSDFVAMSSARGTARAPVIEPPAKGASRSIVSSALPGRIAGSFDSRRKIAASSAGGRGKRGGSGGGATDACAYSKAVIDSPANGGDPLSIS